MFTAVVRVTGAGRLADFRERLRFLMVRDADAEEYSEHHAEGVLEYRFEPKKGIPFPALTATSGEFPELRVDVAWDHGGERGRAVIENGRVLEKSSAQPDSPGVEVRVGEDGRLILGLVINQSMIGYAVTADRHTYFRYREGALMLVDPKEPDAALEATAFGFVEEWIWYDEEEAPVERARYVDYGYPVRGANVRSEKLALLRASGMRYSSLDETTRQASEALVAEWLNRS